MNRAEKIPFNQPPDIKDLDLLEIPIEGVAAYWLSLRKVLKAKKAVKMLQDEADYTSEPYIKHLLELLLSSLDEVQLRKFAEVKQQTIVKDLQRKLVIISIGLLGIAANENPQQVLIRIISKFPISPVVERHIFQAAQELLDAPAGSESVVDIDHRMHLEQLIRHLIFYCMLSRRKGREACSPYVSNIRSAYFTEGLSLILDGFAQDFVKHRLNLQKDEIIYETQRKMDMALEMCLGLKNNTDYEDMFKMANSYLL
jgi:hypothetical protein